MRRFTFRRTGAAPDRFVPEGADERSIPQAAPGVFHDVMDHFMLGHDFTVAGEIMAFGAILYRYRVKLPGTMSISIDDTIDMAAVQSAHALHLQIVPYTDRDALRGVVPVYPEIPSRAAELNRAEESELITFLQYYRSNGEYEIPACMFERFLTAGFLAAKDLWKGNRIAAIHQTDAIHGMFGTLVYSLLGSRIVVTVATDAAGLPVVDFAEP